MKEKTTTPKTKADAFRLGIISAIVISMIMWTVVVPYSPSLDQTEHVDDETSPSWHTIWAGPIHEAFAEKALTAGTSGITEVFFVNNTNTANDTYTVNDTSTIEGWCDAAGLGYASADDFYTELQHSVSFDIVVRIRANKTICANSTGDYGVFNGNRLRVNITSAALGIDALTPMIRVESYNDSTPIIDPYMYCNYWINWTGSYTPVATGYQLAADTSYTITEIRFEAYY